MVSHRPKVRPDAGFTLVEALIATLVLTFGISSIFNLMIVATSATARASRATAASSLASQQMEVLRSTPFAALVDSATGVNTLDVQTANYFRVVTVTGVGTFETRWQIRSLTSPNLRFLEVRTEPTFRGRLARAEFSVIRACTAGTQAGCL